MEELVVIVHEHRGPGKVATFEQCTRHIRQELFVVELEVRHDPGLVAVMDAGGNHHVTDGRARYGAFVKDVDHICGGI